MTTTPRNYLFIEAPDRSAKIDFPGISGRKEATVELTIKGDKLTILAKANGPDGSEFVYEDVSLSLALEEEATLEEELRLWRWIHEEMHCSVPAIQTPSLKCWSVLDVDGESIGEGASPVEAMQAAEKRILQSPGHECI